MSEVARTPHGRSRGTTKPEVDPTQQVDTPAVLSEDTHSELSSPSSPDQMSGDEDSSEGEEYATPLTSDTTADIPPSTAGAAGMRVNLSLKCPVLRGPYHLIRQWIVCQLNKIV